MFRHEYHLWYLHDILPITHVTVIIQNKLVGMVEEWDATDVDTVAVLFMIFNSMNMKKTRVKVEMQLW